MTPEEALKRIPELEAELKLIRSVLTPPKKRKVVKKDYTKRINASILKTPHLYKS